MNKVMVIGNAGGGKSTLSRAICAVHGLPYHSVDEIQWQPGWVATPEAEFTQAHEAILLTQRWLIDGYGSWHSVERRLGEADTVIFVDHPVRVHFWWAAKRQIKALFGVQDGVPKGCNLLSVTFQIFAMIWSLHIEWRPKLMRAIEARNGTARIVHIRSPKELNAFAADPELRR